MKANSLSKVSLAYIKYLDTQCDSRRGFGFDIEFVDHLIHTTRNYS
jgi:hypothetical protein